MTRKDEHCARSFLIGALEKLQLPDANSVGLAMSYTLAAVVIMAHDEEATEACQKMMRTLNERKANA
jgi:hypothetical protein